MRFARLHAEAAESPDIGEVLEENPLAVALFFLSLARCDVYGILPAEPRRYRSKVAPAAVLPTATVALCLDEQEKRGWIRRYTDSTGHELLHILKYHQFQEVRWTNRIGPPEHELPEWWIAPDGLVVYLNGLDMARVRHPEKWSVLVECYCSTTVAQRQTRNKKQETRTTTSTDSPPADADGKQDTPHQAAANACLAVWGLQHTDLEKAKKARFYGAMSKIIEGLEGGCEELAEWARQQDRRVLKPGAKPATAIPAAVRKATTAAGYQLEFTKAREKSGGNGRPQEEFIAALVDGSRIPERDWGPVTGAAIAKLKAEGNWNPKTGRTLTPVKGLCCDDGRAYSSDDWPDGVPQ